MTSGPGLPASDADTPTRETPDRRASAPTPEAPGNAGEAEAADSALRAILADGGAIASILRRLVEQDGDLEYLPALVDRLRERGVAPAVVFEASRVVEALRRVSDEGEQLVAHEERRERDRPERWSAAADLYTHELFAARAIAAALGAALRDIAERGEHTFADLALLHALGRALAIPPTSRPAATAAEGAARPAAAKRARGARGERFWRPFDPTLRAVNDEHRDRSRTFRRDAALRCLRDQLGPDASLPSERAVLDRLRDLEDSLPPTT